MAAGPFSKEPHRQGQGLIKDPSTLHFSSLKPLKIRPSKPSRKRGTCRDLVLFIIIVLGLRSAEAHCPNNCNKRGTCNPDDTCTCFTGWDGAPDCSLRSCPTGPRWSGKPYDALTAHVGSAECSNAGTCDRERGECDCFTGFTGDACQRVRCNNDCSGKGRCLSIAEIALEYGSDSDQDGVGTAYTNWESSKNYVCNCDRGFTGPNCEYAVCPMGDDPDTVPGFDAELGAVTLSSGVITAIAVTTGGEAYNNPVITITGDGSGATATPVVDSNGAIASITITNGGSSYTSATATIVDEYQRDYTITLTTGASSGTLAGEFELRFMGDSITFDADASALDAASMKTALEAHPSIGSVTVTQGSVDANSGAEYTITFTAWESGNFNNLFWHAGNPDVDEFTCITSGISSGTTPTCVLAIDTNTYLKEFRQCSGRGSCDASTGTCACFVGYGGSNCDTKTYEVVTNDYQSTFTIENTGLAFVGSVLKLTSAKAAASDYKFIEALANDVPVFDVRGDGQVYIYSGGLIVADGGAEIIEGGLIVDEDGADIFSTNLLEPVLEVAALGTPFTDIVTVIRAQETGARSFSLLDLQASGSTRVFTVFGNGDTFVRATTDATSSTYGSFQTAGGMAVAKQLYVGGIVVTEDTTDATSSTAGSVMHAGGLAVAKAIYAGTNIVAEGTTTSTSVGSGSLRTNGGLSVALDSYFGGTITATSTNDATSSTSADVMIQGGLGVSMKSYFGDLLTVEDNGIYVQQGGILVDAGGIDITAGGLYVAAGGADVTGGANIKDGLTVETGGGVVKQESTSSTALTAVATSTSFADTVFDVKAARAANAAFNLITAGVGETHIPGKTITSSGTYTDSTSEIFYVEVTAGDTFQWRKGSGSYTSGVSISSAYSAPLLLSDGLYVQFSASTGYITGATWTIATDEASDTVYSATPQSSDTVFFTLDGTGDLSIQTGDILMSASGTQNIDHSDNSAFSITSGGDLILDGVTVNNQAMSDITTIDMTGDLTISTGSISFSSSNTQSITHTGNTGADLSILSTNGNVDVDGVRFKDSNIEVYSTLAQTFTHVGADGADYTISSTSGNVVISADAQNVIVETVTFNAGAISAATDITMDGDLTNSAGSILLTSPSAQSITHTGNTGADLSILSTNGNVDVDGVRFKDSNIEVYSTLAQTFTHVGANGADYTISSTSGNVVISADAQNVIVETVTFNAGAISAATDITMDGDLTNSAGSILLTSPSAQSITHTGNTGADLSILSTNGNVDVDGVRFKDSNIEVYSTLAQTFTHVGANGADYTISSTSGNVVISADAQNVIVETVTFNNGAISTSGTITATDDISTDGSILMTGDTVAITHSGATSLTMSSTSGVVIVEGITLQTQDMTDVNDITMAGDLTNSAGSILLTSPSAQSITHTGNTGADLSILSTSGNVVISADAQNVIVETVTFNAGAISTSGTITATDDISTAGSILMTGDTVAITHSGATSLTMSSTSGVVIVEGITLQTQDMTDVNDITMAGDLTNSAGSILLTSPSAQSITHTGNTGADLSILSTSGNVVISADAQNVIVETVTFNAGAISTSGTITATDDISTAGSILMTGDTVAITHSGATSLTMSSTSGVVIVEGITLQTQDMTDVNDITMAGDLTNSAGSILLTSPSAQSITHTGNTGADLSILSTSGNVVISADAQNVIVETVTFNAGAISTSGTITATDDISTAGSILMTGDTVAITHSGATSLTMSSTSGVVIVEGITLQTQDMTDVNDITMDGDLTNSAGSILLTSPSAQSITHTGNTGADLSILSTSGNVVISADAQNVIVETVTFNAGAISTSGSITATDDISTAGSILMTGDTVAITHSGATSLTMSSTSGVVIVEGITLQTQDMTDVNDITMAGDLTNSAGSILLTSPSAQSITHTGNTGADLSILSTSGNVVISADAQNVIVETVTFNAGAISTSGTITATDDISTAGSILMTGDTVAITHSGATSLTMSSTSGVVIVEGITLQTQDMTDVNDITMDGDLTNSAGSILLTSPSAQSITHTGNTGADLSILSTSGNVVISADAQNVIVETVTFNAGAISTSGTITATDDISTAGSILMTGDTVAITHSGATSLTMSSTSGVVIVEGITLQTQDMTDVNDITMAGDLTNSAGSILLTSPSAQSITHTGNTGADLSILSTNGNVDVDGVRFKDSNIEVYSTLAQTFTHVGADGADYTISSTSGNVVISADAQNVIVETVTFNAGAISAATDITMDGDLTNSAGSILLTSPSAQSITHTGNTGADLSILSTNGNVDVDGVRFKDSNIEVYSTLAQTFTHVGANGADYTISSTSGNVVISADAQNVIVETVTFNAGAISAATDITMDGDLTNSAGSILLTSPSAQSITHTGNTGADLSILSTNGNVDVDGVRFKDSNIEVYSTLAQTFTHVGANGADYTISSTSGNVVISADAQNVIVETVTFNNGAISTSGTITATDDISTDGSILMTGDTVAITHSGATSLTMSSTSGVVIVEGITLQTQDMTDVNDITMAGDLTNSAGSILLTSPSAQSITHTGNTGADLSILSTSGNVVISADAQNVIVETVTFNAGAISTSGTITATDDISTAGSILMTGDTVAITHSGATSLTMSSTSGVVIVEGITLQTQDMTDVNDITMAGDLTNSAGSILLTSPSAQSITHTGNTGADLSILSTSGNVVISADAQNVIVETVTFNAGAISTSGTITATDDISTAGSILMTGDTVAITHSGATSLTMSSTSGVVIVEGITLQTQDMTDVNDITMAGDLTNSAGSILLTSPSAQSITHTGNTGADLSILSTSGNVVISADAQNVIVETVTFNAGAISTSGTITATDDISTAGSILMTGDTVAITHSGATSLTMSSTSGVVIVEGITLQTQDMTDVNDITMDGDLTNSAGSILLTSPSAQSITHTGNTGADLSILSTSGNVVISADAQNVIVETVTFNAGAISTSGSITATDDISTAGSILMTGDTVAITHSGATSLTMSSTSGVVIVEGITLQTQDMTDVNDITMAGDLTNSAGSILLTSPSAQSITHTGNTGADLSILSTSGNVVISADAQNVIVETVTFNAGAISTSGTITATDDISTAGSILMTGDTVAITHSGATSLTMSSTSGVVIVEGITLQTQDMTDVNDITMDGDLTNSAGSILLTSPSAQSITHTGNTGADLSILSTSGNVVISADAQNVIVETVTFNAGAISTSGTITATDDISTAGSILMTGDTVAITHSGATSLTMSSTSGVVIVEGITLQTQDMTDVNDITMAGDLTNSAGSILLTSPSAQSITHTGNTGADLSILSTSGNVVISADAQNVIVETVTFNAGAISTSGTITATDDISTAGSILMTGDTVAITHSGATSLTMSSTSGVVIVEGITLQTQDMTDVNDITMDGDLTNSAGSILLTSPSAQSITHTGNTGADLSILSTSGNVVISADAQNVIVETVTFNAGAISTSGTITATDDISTAGSILMTGDTVAITHSGATSLTMSSTSGVVIVEGITLQTQDMTDVNDITMDGDLTNSAGSILLTSPSAQSITHTGNTGADLSILSTSGNVVISADAQNVIIETVTFNAGAISTSGTITATDDISTAGSILMTGDTVAITHSGATSLTMSSTSGVVIVEGITLQTQDMTDVNDITMAGDLTNSAGSILLTSPSAQSITHTGNTGADLSILSTSGNVVISADAQNVIIETVTFNAGAISTSGTITATDDISTAGSILMTGDTVAITHSGATSLTMSSTSGVVIVEGITLQTQDMTDVNDITMAGDLTNSAGSILLTSPSAQSITHTGNTGADLSILSTSGNVVISADAQNVIIETVTFNAGAISTSGTITATDDISTAGSILMTGDTVAITHSGATSLTMSSTSGVVIVEGITLQTQDMTDVNDITMDGDLTNSAGSILLTSPSAQSITHTGNTGADLSILSTSGNVVISADAQNVIVETVTFNAGAISTSGTITATDDISTAGSILMTGDTVAITHSGATSLTMSSTSGVVIVEGITLQTQDMTDVNDITMDGDLTNSAGSILLTSPSAQSITHTGNTGADLSILSTSGNVVISADAQNVIVETVTFNAGAISTSGTITATDDISTAGSIFLTSSLSQSISHTGAANQDLSITSGGNVIVDGVTMNAGAVSGASTIAMTGTLTSTAGGIALTSSSAQAITHTGAANADLSISSGGNVIVNSVTMNGGAITSTGALSVSTLTTSGDITSGGNLAFSASGASTISHAHSSALTISSGGEVVVNGVTMNGSAVSGASTIGMTGTLTSTAGGIALTSSSAQAIAHTGAANADLSITSGGNVIVNSVTMNGGAITSTGALSVSTLTTSGDITSGGNLAFSASGASTISHAHSSALTISSGGEVVVNGVTMNGGAVSGATTIGMTGTLTSTAGGIALTSSSAQAIAHTGAANADLSITSGGNVIVNSVTMNGGAITSTGALSVSTLTTSGDITSGGNLAFSASGASTISHAHSSALTISSGGEVVVNGVTMNGGAVSGATTIGMTGTLTSTAGGIALTSSSAQAITHTGAANADLSISSGGNVIVNSVTMNGGAITSTGALSVSTLTTSGDITSGGNLAFSASGASTISHAHSSALTISSGGEVVVNGVTMNGSAVSGASTIGMTGTLTSTAGGIALTSSSAQAIAHTGAANADLSITSGGNVIVNSVTMNGGAITSTGALSVSTLTTSGDITSGGNLAFSASGASTISHAHSSALTISSGGEVVVNGVTMNGGAVSGATTIGMTGTLTSTAGGIALTSSSAQAITHTGAANADLSISSGGNVVVNSVTMNGGAITSTGALSVSTLTTSGDITSGGNLAFGASGASTITHSHSSALTISSGGDVVVHGVTMNGGAVSGASTIGMTGTLTSSGGGITLTSSAAQVIAHTGAANADLSITSGGNVVVDGVTMNAGAVSGASTIAMTSTLTSSGGGIALTSGSAQAITHTGAANEDLSITSGGNVIVNSVTMNGGAITSTGALSVSTLTTSGDITSGGNLAFGASGASTITHSHSSALTISSGGDVVVHGVTMNGGAVSGATTIGMTGTLTSSAGGIALTSSSAQAITHTGAANADLSITSGGNVVVNSVTMNGGAITSTGALSVSTLTTSGDITSGGNLSFSASGASTISHSHSSALTISSGGDVVVHGVTMNGGAVSGATTIGMTGTLTSSGGGITLTSSAAQAIAHTGAANADLSITSGGNVVVDGVTMNAGAVSGASTIAMTSTLTSSGGGIALTSGTAQAITHTGAANEDLSITSGGNVIVNSVTMNGGAITSTGALSVSTLTTSGDITSGGNLAFGASGASTITHSHSSALTISSGGDVVVHGVTMNGGAVSGASTIGMTGTLTSTAGGIALTSSSAQAITHTGAANADLSITSGGNVVVNSVTMNGGAITSTGALSVSTLTTSGDITSGGNLAFGASGASTITHSHSSALTISSGGDVVVHGVTMNGGAVSGASTIGMTGTLTSSGGGITLTSSSAQVIAHTGAANADLSITSGGNVVVNSVTMNGGAITSTGALSVSTLTTSGDITSGGNLAFSASGATTITHSHSSALTISSGGDVVVHGVTMNGGAVSGASTIGMTGTLTSTAGGIALTSSSAQAITHTGAANADLSITSGGNVVVNSVTMNGGAITSTGALSVSTLTTSGDITSGGNLAFGASGASTITHSHSSALTISSGGDVVVQGVSFSTSNAISDVLSLSMTGDVSLSKDIASISHTGATSLTVSSSSGAVIIESVSFDGTAISNVGTISVGGNQVIGSQATAVTDISATYDPGDGTIGGLTISASYSQSEIQALRDECEKLRDWLNESRSQVNDLLSKLRTHGLIASA